MPDNILNSIPDTLSSPPSSPPEWTGSRVPAPALGFVVCDDHRIYGAGMSEDECLDNALECLCGFCERSALKKMLELCQCGVRYPLRQIPATAACVTECQRKGTTEHYRIHEGTAYSLGELAEPLSA